MAIKICKRGTTDKLNLVIAPKMYFIFSDMYSLEIQQNDQDKNSKLQNKQIHQYHSVFCRYTGYCCDGQNIDC